MHIHPLRITPECIAPLIEPQNSKLKITKLQCMHTRPSQPQIEKTHLGAQKKGCGGAGGRSDTAGGVWAGNNSAAVVGEQVRACGASTGLEAAISDLSGRQAE